MLSVLLFKRVVIISVLSLLSACGGNYDPETVIEPEDENGSSGIQLLIPAQPMVAWDGEKGTTKIILQFSVKDEKGRPMDVDAYRVHMNVDDLPVSVESLTTQSSVDLDVNLYFGMVLDASSSMVLHNPPAFELMKAAAKDSYQEVLNLWSSRPGDVQFSAIWFDSLINQSVYSPASTEGWQPEDILSIPTPVDGTYTKLYAAVDQMAIHMKSKFDQGVMNGPRDQYVMLVFSDGEDTYSHWDNSDDSLQLLTTNTGASYNQYGTAPVSLESVKQSIQNHPRLTTHVIGLGSAIKADELQQIATAGKGVFLSNPDSANVSDLFQEVMNEFTSLQTRGLEVPWASGKYKVSLVVTNSATGDADQYDFNVLVGESSAALVE